MRQAGTRNGEFGAEYVSERIVPMRVWDAPTRLFHWALVILLGISWLTESRGWMRVHMLSGYSIIALLLFRVAWGFAGSQTARFSQFIRGPQAALRHLAHLLRREPDTEVGHNAAGGWMVLVMLALLMVQVATGLCANDDANTEGPLFNYVGKEWSDWLSHIHAVNFVLIQIAVVLHVAGDPDLSRAGAARSGATDDHRKEAAARCAVPAAVRQPGAGGRAVRDCGRAGGRRGERLVGEPKANLPLPLREGVGGGGRVNGPRPPPHPLPQGEGESFAIYMASSTRFIRDFPATTPHAARRAAKRRRRHCISRQAALADRSDSRPRGGRPTALKIMPVPRSMCRKR